MTMTTTNFPFEFPNEISSHIFGFMTTSKLNLLGKVNRKTHKNIKSASFLRRIHSILREKKIFDAFNSNWEKMKEHKALVSIITKLRALYDVNDDFQGYLNHLDTSSFENFNKSLMWLEEYLEDEEWLDLISPHPKSPKRIIWSEEELKIVDRWHFEFNAHYALFILPPLEM